MVDNNSFVNEVDLSFRILVFIFMSFRNNFDLFFFHYLPTHLCLLIAQANFEAFSFHASEGNRQSSVTKVETQTFSVNVLRLRIEHDFENTNFSLKTNFFLNLNHVTIKIFEGYQSRMGNFSNIIEKQ